MKKSVILKSAISFALSFLLMLSIIFAAIFLIGKYSMLSLRGVEYTCERVEYYEGVRDEIREQANHLAIPFGIDKKCLKGTFKKRQVEKDMLSVLKAQMKGKTPEISTTAIRKNIIKNVEQKYGELSKKEQESLEKYIHEVEKIYRKKMVIPGSSYIVKSIHTSTRISMIVIPICAFIALLCIFFLVSMRRYVFEGLRYVVYGIWGAGIMLVTAFSAMISNGFIYKFNISDVFMRKFYTYWLGHTMLMYVFAGILLLLFGVLLIYIIFRQQVRDVE